jgi:sialic acid synthase SpsE/sugar phosphate isomerase/epimerase
MIIEKLLNKFVINSESSIKSALEAIDSNESGFVIVASSSGRVEGVLTDGDVRRWILSHPTPNVANACIEAANPKFSYAFQDDAYDKISHKLTDLIKFLPIVDRQMRCVAIARNRTPDLYIGTRKISENSPAFIIAEIGNNHNGSFELACKLVDLAIDAGADCAKFQMRDLKSLYSNSGNANDAKADLGAQYTLDLLSKFQLSNADLKRIFDYCTKKGIIPLCTPWDEASLIELEAYGLCGYKVASADLTNHAFLQSLAKTGKSLICSTGMSNEAEIVDASNLLKANGAKFVLLHCNSTYPAPLKDVNLKYVKRLREICGGIVGYSGHERGINVALAAVCLGAKVIEKHFTIDRNMEGNDHRVSLLPSEFKQMVVAIREIEDAMGSSGVRRISQGELMNREVLGKSIFAQKAIKKGGVISSDALEIRSPGQGLPPYRIKDLVGSIAKRDFEQGDVFFPTDLMGGPTGGPRPYKFDRPFGIPVRYHDADTMIAMSNFSVLEFHLSYKDLDEDPSQFLKSSYRNLNLVVHAPELFAGDHVLDLCSRDISYREKSIVLMKRVVDVTLKIAKHFPDANRIPIVTNVGGFSFDHFTSKEDRASLYELVASSFSKIEMPRIDLIPQTMPPFPWHFGGQRFHNLFVDPDEIASFCKQYDKRICLDVSHSKLACNHFKWGFDRFIEVVGPYISHMHLADSSGVDGEGLQIGDGQIDFRTLHHLLQRYAPKNASFIPEIWQGHKNNGEGFWLSLDRLEDFFQNSTY